MTDPVEIPELDRETSIIALREKVILMASRIKDDAKKNSDLIAELTERVISLELANQQLQEQIAALTNHAD